MLNLILKDILVQKRERTIWIAAILGVLNAFTLQEQLGMSVMLIVLTANFLVLYANAFDYKYNGDILANSLPVGRATVVSAKYASVFLYFTVSVLITLISGFSLQHLGVGYITRLAGPDLIIAALSLVSLYYAVFFPLYFKFGYMKSRWINIFALLLMFSAANIFSNLATAGGNTSESLDAVLSVLIGQAPPAANLMMLALAAAVLVISIRLSVRIYANKEF